MKRLTVAMAALAVLVAGPALAQPVVDGTLVGDESAYGDILFVQTVQTQFGDSTDPSQMTANGGSEITGLYATVSNDTLYVLVTGNLESNFNKLDIFIDSVDGGFNTIPFDNFGNFSTPFGNELPEVDPFSGSGGINGNGALQGLGGLTFDEGFEADFFMTFANGTESPAANDSESWAFTGHFSPVDTLATFGGTVPEDPSPQWGAFGGNTEPAVVGGTIIDANTAGAEPFDVFWTERQTDNSFMNIAATIDNSNIAGVAGGTEAADPVAAEAVQTGIEFAIPLSLIGNPEGDILIAGFVNGSGQHDFISNQVIGGLPAGFGNLAGPSTVNFAGEDFVGNQFVTVSQGVAPIAGDFDGDGDVDTDDLNAWQSGYGIAVDAGISDGDADGDGDVDGADLLIWQQNFTGPAGGSLVGGNVPEPSTLGLAVLAILGLGLLAKRK